MPEEDTEQMSRLSELERVPVMALRDVVVYPHMVIPLFAGRDKSKQALDLAMQGTKQIMLIAQRQAELDEPQADDLYDTGTLATILQLLKMPDGTVKVLVEGGQRAMVNTLHMGEFFAADITVVGEHEAYDPREVDVLVRSVVTQFEHYVKLNKKVPPEVLTSLSGDRRPGSTGGYGCRAHGAEAGRKASHPGSA